jgi:ABC-type oligopeptide transport system ATPase subunit
VREVLALLKNQTPGVPLLRVHDLAKWYDVRRRFFSRSRALVRAVDGVSFELMQGETLGLVGESGSGKSTLGRLLLRLEEPTRGEVFFGGKDIFGLGRRDLMAFRRTAQAIFQDPRGSLNPRMTVESILTEPLVVHRIVGRRAAKRRAAELLEMVGLPSGYLNRYPHEISGGERQRIGIARALSLSPSFLVADEPVTALDMSVRGQVVNLLMELQAQLGLSYLLIAHDLGLVCRVAQRVMVMYRGKIVEVAPAERLLTDPRHPYTRVLLSALPGRK